MYQKASDLHAAIFYIFNPLIRVLRWGERWYMKVDTREIEKSRKTFSYVWGED